MNYINPVTTERKALVVFHPKSSLDLLRYRRRWIQAKFSGLSVELAGPVAELAFASGGRRM